MSWLRSPGVRAALVSVVCASACTTVSAQGIFGGEFERGTRPGVYVPRDGMSFSHWYNYDTGPAFFLGVDGQRLWQLEYYDRMDRAERFGYSRPMARPPLFNRLLGR